MQNTITFEATHPTNKTTYTQSLTLSETDQEKLSQYLTTILEDNTARYVFKTEAGEELDINPLRENKFITIIHTKSNEEHTIKISENQAEKIIKEILS